MKLLRPALASSFDEIEVANKEDLGSDEKGRCPSGQQPLNRHGRSSPP